MKLIVGLLVVLVVVNLSQCKKDSHSGEDGDGHKKNDDKFKKKKECMKQTEELKACCPLPKSSEDYMKDPECGHHLEGIDEKEGKDKFHTIVCFVECMFTSRGLLGGDDENKEILWDEVRKGTNEIFGEGDNLKEVTEKAIDFCENICKTIL